MQPRLKELIIKEIQPSLKEKFGYKNLFMGPHISKVVLNMGLGIDGNDSKIIKSCQEDLANITGQMPVITKFRKSIANFKTRKGSNAGVKVTGAAPAIANVTFYCEVPGTTLDDGTFFPDETAFPVFGLT